MHGLTLAKTAFSSGFSSPWTTANRGVLFWIPLALFLSGAVVGYIGPSDRVYEHVAGEQSEAMSLPDAEAFRAVFFHNARVTAIMLVAGVITFAFPMLFLSMNGYLLGAYAAVSASMQIPMYVYLAMVLPHGVLEVPAMFISCGYGVVLGSVTLAAVRKSRSASELFGNVRGEWLPVAKRVAILYALVLLPMLAASAAVEVYFTGRLVGLFSGAIG